MFRLPEPPLPPGPGLCIAPLGLNPTAGWADSWATNGLEASLVFGTARVP